jgi:class 3 adenylate cyclase/CHASE2 domain-containing sensor protein
MEAVDTPRYENVEATDLEPQPGKGPDLERYRRPGCDCTGIPRDCYAEAVERLGRWGAKAVTLDIMFRDRRVVPPTDAAENQRLADALFKANNVVSAAVSQPVALDRSRDPTRTADNQLTPPAVAVAENAWAIGSPKVDPRDQEYAVELLQTAYGADGALVDYFSMPYLAYCLATGRPREDLAPWQERLIDGTQPRLLGGLFSSAGAPASPPPGKPPEAKPAAEGVDLVVTGNVTVDEAFYQKRLLINYSSGADPQRGRFRPVRLSWLLFCSDKEGRERFEDKIVLIGDPAQDLHRTVVGAMPGTEVLANAVQTLLQDRPIVPVPAWQVLLVTLAGAVFAAGVFRHLPFLPALALFALDFGLLLLIPQHLIGRDVWFPAATPPLSVLVAGTASGLMALGPVQTMVARLVPARVSRAVERAGGFGVEEGTVLMSDIRGYSTFSEFMDPATVMSQLNTYFASVQEILDRHGGHFMKSPGDCVVAWFSEEKRGEHHSERAIRAAIDLVMNAVRFRNRWAEEHGQTFNIGVGVNSGPMGVGYLDTRRHLEPTVIGDTVNLAARLESLTKEYGVPLIVSEETLAPVRAKFIAESLGSTVVKGRSQPVTIYRIIGISSVGETAPRPRGLGRLLSLCVRRDAPSAQVITTAIEEPSTAASHPPADQEETPAGAAR